MTRFLRAALLILATFTAATGCRKKLEPIKPDTSGADAEAAARERARLDSIKKAEQARKDSMDRVLKEGAGKETDATPPAAGRTEAEVKKLLTAPIYFDLDKSELTDTARGTLDVKIGILKSRPEIKLRINGHTDDRGSDEYNLALGVSRAAEARRYMVTNGIDEKRFQIQSFGAEQPVDPEQNEEAWAKNRRCEFEIMGNK
jgi:peptidoglycan-associated lipoprotein